MTEQSQETTIASLNQDLHVPIPPHSCFRNASAGFVGQNIAFVKSLKTLPKYQFNFYTENLRYKGKLREFQQTT